MRPSLRTSLLLTVCAASTPDAQGPGLGNLTYDTGELFTAVSVLHSNNGHGMGTMVGGYFMLLDAGDTNTILGIEFWDLSDPRDATLAHREEGPQVQSLRDAHAIAMSTSYGARHVAFLAGPGIRFWNVDDPSSIFVESQVLLPNIPTATYTGIWWLFWQAPYLYVAGTSAGIYIVRVDDIASPQFVKLVPPSALGGVVANQVFAIGNLLVAMTSKDPGFATLDISDPLNPSFIQTIPGARGYSHVVAGGQILTCGGDGGPVQMFVHDLGHDGAMSLVGSVGSGFSNGAYGSYQDGYFHAGMSNVYAKFDVDGMQVVGTATTGIANRDEDFCQVLGNLAFVGDDHSVGSGLYVHDVQPDSTGPAVTWVHPADGAQNQALTMRVGVSMSDNIDFESPSPQTFAVQPLGGAPLSGKYSTQMGIVNFCPDDPLSPGTVYEVVVDGMEDLVGNAGPVFRSTFSTASGPTGPPPSTPVTVQNLAAESGKTYLTGLLAQGSLRYVDRDYRYGPIPSRYAGHAYVLTANDDKFGVAASWLTFDVDEPVEVLVLFDDRATSLPAWLQTWTATGEATSGHDAYSREFPAGTVALGGNANSPMAGAESMYMVVVLPSVAAPTSDPPVLAATPTGAPATLQAGAATGAGPFTYTWDFGDGSPPAGPSSSSSTTHVYAEPGRYPVSVTTTGAQGTTTAAAIQIVYDPPTLPAPTRSGPIVYDASGTRVFNVNPDNDTVTAIDATTLAKVFEAPVGAGPRTLAFAPDGSLWVACQDDASVSVLRTSDGALLRTIALPRASRPYGIAFRPDGAAAYVSLEAGTPSWRLRAGERLYARSTTSGRKLGFVAPGELANVLELHPTSGRVLRALALRGKARGLAVSHDSTRLFVTRFVSPHPASEGVVWEVDTATFAALRSLALRFDPGPDTERSGRGVPNYLSSLTLSPNGERLLVPSKKDNTARGLFRDGEPLTFESRTRTIVSAIDLTQGAEDFAARIDLDDRDMAQAVAYSPLGDLFVVATQGSNSLAVFDAKTRSSLATLPTGRAPQGLVFSPDGTRLFVHAFLSREVTVYDTSELVQGLNYNPARIADVSTVASELLAADVLNGKRIFYDASDRRMNLDGYISCASCHLDGGSDGQVWDFTQVGEGLRNTVPLTGRAGVGHGHVHWTANFDEIHDFENDIRLGFAGAGFLLDPDFAATENPLGPPKAGLSSDLDDLAAFVTSLATFPPSPHRRPNGELTADAEQGKAIFQAQGCATCHTPPTYTDGLRHDVGTIRPSSGTGIGAPLAGIGFDTPTLRALWQSPPYLHNGAAARLEAVLDEAAHGGANTLTANARKQLAAYLLQIE